MWRSRVANRIRIVRQLRRPGDLVLFLRILLFAAAVPLLVRLRLPSLARLLEPRLVPPATDPAKAEKIIAYTDAVLQFGRPLVHAKCLTRALCLYYFLRREGVDVTVHFGVEKSGDTFAGHSWLMMDGEPYLEEADPRLYFSEVYGFGRQRLKHP
jgi:hypothetical protein